MDALSWTLPPTWLCVCVRVRVCVCVFSSHQLAKVPATVPPIKARRALHVAVYLHSGLHLLSVFLCPTNNRGHTGGGQHLGSFLLLDYGSFMPHRPPAVIAFYREKGSAVPIPRQEQSRILSTHEAFQLCIAFHYQV